MKRLLKLENLIYLTIFALPGYLLRLKVFGFPVNILDCLLLACLSLWLGFYREQFDCTSFFKRHKAFIFSIGLLLFGLIISVLVNKNYAVGAGMVKSWFLLPIAFSLVLSSVVKRDKLKNVFWAYYAGAFFVALFSLGYSVFGIVTFDSRLQGFFNSPNYLAMYLAPAIFIGYSAALKITGKKKLLLFGSMAIILFVVYLTFSYANWVSIGGAFLVALVFGSRLNWKRGFVVLFLMLGAFFLQADKNKLVSFIELSDRSSLSSRLMIWNSSSKMLEDSWLWGIGVGNFQEKYLENQKYFSPYLEWAVPHPHNLLLAFWLYGGIFGLVGFLALICNWFFHILRLQKNPELKFIGLGIMCFILLHGLVDTTYFKNDLAVVFWLLFVLL